MKDFINNAEELKNKILPKIEEKVRNELLQIVEKKIESNPELFPVDKEELLKEYKKEILKQLGVTSFEQLFEIELENIVKIFNKNFPYHSMEHFIESHLNEMVENIKYGKYATISDENDND